MSRKPGDTINRRSHQKRTYLTEREQEAVVKIGTLDGYRGEADVLRQGFALLVNTRHPEFKEHLRKDLKST